MGGGRGKIGDGVDSLLLVGGFGLIILPGSRWNALPPGTLTRIARTARQGLKPILE